MSYSPWQERVFKIGLHNEDDADQSEPENALFERRFGYHNSTVNQSEPKSIRNDYLKKTPEELCACLLDNKEFETINTLFQDDFSPLVARLEQNDRMRVFVRIYKKLSPLSRKSYERAVKDNYNKPPQKENKIEELSSANQTQAKDTPENAQKGNERKTTQKKESQQQNKKTINISITELMQAVTKQQQACNGRKSAAKSGASKKKIVVRVNSATPLIMKRGLLTRDYAYLKKS